MLGDSMLFVLGKSFGDSQRILNFTLFVLSLWQGALGLRLISPMSPYLGMNCFYGEDSYHKPDSLNLPGSFNLFKLCFSWILFLQNPTNTLGNGAEFLTPLNLNRPLINLISPLRQ